MPAAARRYEIALLYGAGVAQGLALVAFPAASAILTSPQGFHLSNVQYGTLFVPQVLFAMLASAGGAWLARRYGLRSVLMLGLAADLLAMSLFAGSAWSAGTVAAFALLCIATSTLGIGFGATVMALNTLVEGIFPHGADAAVLALNALLGAGTALAPMLIALFTTLGAWWALPLLVALLLAALLAGMRRAALQLPYSPTGATGRLPPRYWCYAGLAVLYGVAETLCGNWSTLYLTAERGVTAAHAAWALAAFWTSVTLGRLLFAALQRVLAVRWIFLALPVLLAGAFQLIARASGAAAGIAAFTAAGLACSALLPLSISLAGQEFRDRAALMSGSLIASYQAGYGLAAFGVGPLHEMAAWPLSSVYAAGSLVAIVFLLIAAGLARRSPKSPVAAFDAHRK